MRRVFSALTAVAVAFAMSSAVFAVAPHQAEKKPAEKNVKMEKKASTLAVNGKVERFDDATKTLTLSTSEGERQFTLGADAKIMSGANAATTADLAGKNVKVTYSHVDGKNVASKVTLATSHPTSTKSTAKK
jgi:hypothetical protein